MIKLQDFARQHGVTDRAIQKHIKKYEVELEGLYERRGSNGTWLSDDACRILRSKMKSDMVVVDEGNNKIAELEAKIEKLEERIERKDIIIENLQEREAKKDKLIATMEESQKLLEEKREEQINSAKDELKLELEQKYQDSEQKLHEHYTEKIAGLQQELDAEKNRKLTIRERFFGQKQK